MREITGPIEIRQTAEKWLDQYVSLTVSAIDRGDWFEAFRQAKQAVATIRKAVALEYRSVYPMREYRAQDIARAILYNCEF